MTSQATLDSSLLSPDDISEISTATSTVQTKRKPTSAVREHTREINLNSIIESEFKSGEMVCLHCLPPNIPYHSSTTTNMQYHLKSKHDIEVASRTSRAKQTALQQLKDSYTKAQAEGVDLEDFQRTVFRERLKTNLENITEALVRLMVVQNESFHLAEAAEFHALMTLSNPEWMSITQLSSASTLKRKVEQVYHKYYNCVREALSKALSHIHLSLDIWTSPNRHLLLGVCSHFIDQDAKLRTILLGLRTVEGHSGENQWDVLQPMLIEFGINDRIGGLIGDGSSTNDTLSREISTWLETTYEAQWDAKLMRLYCCGHIINLVVQDFLFKNQIDLSTIETYEEEEQSPTAKLTSAEQKAKAFRALGPLGKLHNIITHPRQSGGRTKQFIKILGRMIPVDNRTRWNSWYQMLDVALQHESAIDQYVKENIGSLNLDYLPPKDWITLRTIRDFLQPFYQATMDLQGHGKIHLVLKCMAVLSIHLNRSVVRILILFLKRF